MIPSGVAFNARARLSRLLAPLCLGATFLGLTVAACSVPEFDFEPPPLVAAGGDGSVVVPHCRNGELDADLGESDFDCGRGCTPCGVAKHCSDVADCEDGLLCHEGSCLEAGCMNEVRDGAETDVDCGGDGCKPCLTDQSCAQGADCESAVCEGGECRDAACGDQVRNGRETGVDCGGDCEPCVADEPCVVGKDCISGECNGKVCGSVCQDGFANCDLSNTNACEVNTRTDLENCGVCGNACDLPHATSECSAGECRIQTDGCDVGFMDCDGDPKNGCEVDLKTNKLNCGACHKVCPDLNGSPSCAAGLCEITCNEGFEDCDDKRENGCEVNLQSSSQNCEECGKKCAADPGYSAYCKEGVCGQTMCSAGKGDCNGDPVDACETTLTNDVENCGGCGIKCEAVNANVACVNSKCVISSCTGKFADCGGGYADGCETSTDTSTTHCGGCGKGCTISNGSPKCDAGSCEVNSCSGTFRDCDGDPKNGCEINIATNTKSCGGCGAEGTDCGTKYPNATSACLASACTAPLCNAGYGNCDGDPSDGCETNTTNDESHCGGCGKACAFSGAHVTSNECVSSQCDPQCSTNYLTCDGNRQNGCEADKLSDEDNCGACGTVCSDGPSAHVTSNLCQSGDCDPICSGTYRDCDASRTNGCEVDSGNNASHCGGCGNVCQTGAAAHVSSNPCSGSACRPQCSALYDDCDNDGKNGCEKDVSADRNNCGACGTTCGTTNASATSCSAGACNPICNSGWGKCATPEQGCLTRLGTTTNCAQCGQSCSGGTPFCAAGNGCVAFRDIEVVTPTLSATAGWIGNNGTPAEIRLNHNLQTPRSDASGNANNRMVLVGVATTDNYTAMENVSVTYAGTPMLLAFEQLDPGKHSYAGIYYLLESGLPESGTNRQVVASFGATNTWGHAGVDVVELRNVMQVAPIASGGAGVDMNCSPVATRSASLSFTQSGSLIYGVLGARHSTAAALVDNTVTQLSNRQQTTPDGMTLATAYVKANSGRSLGWDVTNCYNTAISLVAIKRLSAN
ncbi:MAG: hypothetical protein K0R38_5383 [Polyangiaceae bacterium]|nr:hypothetical protein [Polyangiaceae bacterium]